MQRKPHKTTQVQTQTAQNTTQGDAATPLETGTRQRTNAEKQRAAEAKAARVAGRTRPGKAAEALERHPRAQQVPELGHGSPDTRPGAADRRRGHGYQQ